MCCNYLLVILVGMFYHLWFDGLELIDLFVIKDLDKNYKTILIYKQYVYVIGVMISGFFYL